MKIKFKRAYIIKLDGAIYGYALVSGLYTPHLLKNKRAVKAVLDVLRKDFPNIVDISAHEFTYCHRQFR